LKRNLKTSFLSNLQGTLAKRPCCSRPSSTSISTIQVSEIFRLFFLFILGNCSKDEFLKAITKIGITGFTDQNLLDLFETYDEDKSGELDYKEFVGALYSNSSISKKAEDKKQEEPQEKKYKEGSKAAYLKVEG
jgi:Ca2+-binding EF-hand superfamily protein